MAEQQQWYAGKPDYETFGLALASDTEAYGGHLVKAAGTDQASCGLSQAGGQQRNCGAMASERCSATPCFRQCHGSPADGDRSIKTRSHQ